MEVTTEVALDAEEAENEQAARTQSGGAGHVTILMAVGFQTDNIRHTLADGAIVKAVAVDGVVMVEVGNRDPDTGDTTDGYWLLLMGYWLRVTGSAESAVETLAADHLPDVDGDVEETGEVDFGWGIVVGNLSLKIASFPELLATD